VACQASADGLLEPAEHTLVHAVPHGLLVDGGRAADAASARDGRSPACVNIWMCSRNLRAIAWAADIYEGQ
jgi:hypothetical protein